MLQHNLIAITGASSGLGRALAEKLGRPGVTLHLAGRDAARLAATAAAARLRGATATESILDVTDEAACAAWITGCGRLDLVIANAGVSVGPGKANIETAAQVQKVFATNVTGVFNTIMPAIAMMAKQPLQNGWRGQVVVIGSIAGLIALPTSPAYCAAKAALDFWMAAAAPGAAKDGIRLTIVRPGFIRTPMTAKNTFKMPGLMDADKAAAIIVTGITAGKRSITFPAWFAAFTRLGSLLPKSVFALVPRKPA